MAQHTWLEIRCLVPGKEADLLSEELFQLTSNGVCTANMAVDTFSVSTILEPEDVCLLAYISDDQDPDPVMVAIEQLLNTIRQRTGHDIPAATSSIIHEEDWANNWKAYFKPTRIGNHLVIKPSWESYAQQQGDLIIELDPGMAFGTGTHPTTRLCMEALERLLQLPSAPMSVLDVGTGSGVLAIAAALLGGTPVVGIDTDPDAVSVALHNAEQNGIAEQIISNTTPLDQLPGQFDLVVANILAEDLVRMRHHLTRHLANSGILVLSGILQEKEDLVIMGFTDTGLKLATTSRCGDWSCLEFRSEE